MEEQEILEEVVNDSEGSEVVTQIDYSEQFQKVIDYQEQTAEQLDTLLSYLDLIGSASSSVLTYAVFYVPLIFIVLMLWWFFKQFIR